MNISHGSFSYEINKIIYTYDGSYLANKQLPHGYGVLFRDSKLVYDGAWYFGKYNGNGNLYLDTFYVGKLYKNVVYSGNFNNGFPHGTGSIYGNEIIYMGDIRFGVICGNGTWFKDNIPIYHGKWLNGSPISFISIPFTERNLLN